MRAAIRSQEDPASGLFAAFVMAAALAADGRTRSRSPRPCRRGGGRTQVAYGDRIFRHHRLARTRTREIPGYSCLSSVDSHNGGCRVRRQVASVRSPLRTR